ITVSGDAIYIYHDHIDTEGIFPPHHKAIVDHEDHNMRQVPYALEVSGCQEPSCKVYPLLQNWKADLYSGATISPAQISGGTVVDTFQDLPGSGSSDNTVTIQDDKGGKYPFTKITSPKSVRQGMDGDDFYFNAIKVISGATTTNLTCPNPH